MSGQEPNSRSESGSRPRPIRFRSSTSGVGVTASQRVPAETFRESKLKQLLGWCSRPSARSPQSPPTGSCARRSAPAPAARSARGLEENTCWVSHGSILSTNLPPTIPVRFSLVVPTTVRLPAIRPDTRPCADRLRARSGMHGRLQGRLGNRHSGRNRLRSGDSRTPLDSGRTAGSTMSGPEPSWRFG